MFQHPCSKEMLANAVINILLKCLPIAITVCPRFIVKDEWLYLIFSICVPAKFAPIRPPQIHLTRINFEVPHQEKTPVFIGREWLFRKLEKVCLIIDVFTAGWLLTYLLQDVYGYWRIYCRMYIWPLTYLLQDVYGHWHICCRMSMAIDVFTAGCLWLLMYLLKDVYGYWCIYCRMSMAIDVFTDCRMSMAIDVFTAGCLWLLTYLLQDVDGYWRIYCRMSMAIDVFTAGCIYGHWRIYCRMSMAIDVFAAGCLWLLTGSILFEIFWLATIANQIKNWLAISDIV